MSIINSNNNFDIENQKIPELVEKKLYKVKQTKKCSNYLLRYLLSINAEKIYIFIIIVLSFFLTLIIISTKDIKIFPTELLDKFKNKINIRNDYKIYRPNNNRTFFFEKDQDELDYCTDYGLMIYDYYYDGKIIEGSNIGDYIQSLAALQFLPLNCKPYFVDRDLIQFYHGPKVKLIINGWNLIHEGNKYTSNEISPIYISYHIRNGDPLPSIFLEKLKKFAPIGCRDLKTKKQLNKYGIDAYFSSCITTTLDIDYRANETERTNEIIFIDYEFGNFPDADEFLYSLKAYNFKNIIHIKHQFDIKMTHVERFKYAKNLLDRYARAKLIISTRLHGALPCLALNTPVIFINKEYNYRRYPGIYELFNTVGINSDKNFEIRVNINDKGLVYNSKKYLEYSNLIKEKLRKF